MPAGSANKVRSGAFEDERAGCLPFYRCFQHRNSERTAAFEPEIGKNSAGECQVGSLIRVVGWRLLKTVTSQKMIEASGKSQY